MVKAKLPKLSWLITVQLDHNAAADAIKEACNTLKIKIDTESNLNYTRSHRIWTGQLALRTFPSLPNKDLKMSQRNLINDLIQSLCCLPGVGSRSAQRIAYHLLCKQRSRATQH